MLSRKLAALAALSLMTASTVAHAQSSAQALSVAPAAAPVQGANELEGGGATIWIIGAVVLGLAIWGIIELTSDDDDEPTSP